MARMTTPLIVSFVILLVGIPDAKALDAVPHVQLTAWPLPDRANRWGLKVDVESTTTALQSLPVQLEFWDSSEVVSDKSYPYDSLERDGESLVGRATVAGPGLSRFTFEDHWRQQGNVLRLRRTVTVRGNDASAFLSAITLSLARSVAWPEARWFAPGMIYGGCDHLSAGAIGGRSSYRPGCFTMRIRADRLPAPLVLAHLDDGFSLAVLDPLPLGSTTLADAVDVTAAPLVDAAFQFGAVGAQERGPTMELGYWFPGSEGEVTYAGNTYPGGQMHRWRRRYHPVRDGLVQHYEVAFRIGGEKAFPDSYQAAWRWAWETLNPAIAHHDVDLARRGLVDMLSSVVVQSRGGAGIPNYIDAIDKNLQRADRRAVMGFCGKNLEAARCLLREAALDHTARGERLRHQAERIIAAFLRLKMAPPEGEGFALDSGEAVCALPRDNQVYLRSFGDDVQALLDAYQHESKAGREHPEWMAWCRSFADWLLTQQQAGGGFPRSWRPGTGAVASASPNSSYNAVPLLVSLFQITADRRYLTAAERAAELCWTSGQDQGRFIGGTIDNPDVIDKEAATLSLEAYLSLFEATRAPKWLDRARAAAANAETWIYLWNVPMPPGAAPSSLHWKSGVPTMGLQLISTGHSLVDEFMASTAGAYARLYQLTGDRHDLDVARILCHNTKSMLALAGRTYDLGVPGWQQEHWSLAPVRGRGLHRGWLPWVATSQLDGIYGLMELDPAVSRTVLESGASP